MQVVAVKAQNPSRQATRELPKHIWKTETSEVWGGLLEIDTNELLASLITASDTAFWHKVWYLSIFYILSFIRLHWAPLAAHMATELHVWALHRSLRAQSLSSWSQLFPTCGILAPRSGLKPPTPERQGTFLTTRPPGKFLLCNLETSRCPLNTVDWTNCTKYISSWETNNILEWLT